MKHEPISELRRYAADLEAEVSSDRARAAARRALLNPSGPVRRPRRAIVAIAATALMGLSNVALATAANPSAPGDMLYGVDRAYESLGSAVGLGGTHAAERALEVRALVERGASSQALEHVIETLTTLLGSDDPVGAVEEFTTALDGNDGQALATALEAARATEFTGADIAAIASDFAAHVLDDLDLPENARPVPGGPAERPPASPSDTRPGNTNPGAGTPGQPPGQGGG